MEHIDIQINPILLVIGPFAVRWSGLLVAIGIAVAVFVAIREARRRNLDDYLIYTGAFWGLVGGTFGARLLHVFERLDFYLQNPTLILGLPQGGMAVWGGIIGGLAALAIRFMGRKRLLASLADVAAPALLAGLVVGRLGSIVNGDAQGTATDLPWGFVYIYPETLAPSFGKPTHPYPVYEILWNSMLLGGIWRLRRRPLPSGALFLTFLIGYAAGRLLLTLFRQGSPWFLGLQVSQIVSLVVIGLAAPLLVRALERGRITD